MLVNGANSLHHGFILEFLDVVLVAKNPALHTLLEFEYLTFLVDEEIILEDPVKEDCPGLTIIIWEVEFAHLTFDKGATLQSLREPF